MLQAISPLFILSGFLVGLLVGLTGVGGGSLMTPLLVLVFGVEATAAVGTDLLYAAVTKSAGTMLHHRRGTIDWQVTRRLATGSVPAAILTLTVLYALGVRGAASPPAITIVLACALILTAICVVSHRWLRMLTTTGGLEPKPRRVAVLTIIAGLVLGVLVTLSSVGAGAIGMTALVLLHPRTPIAKLVGSDIAHAVPLTLIAGIGHWPARLGELAIALVAADWFVARHLHWQLFRCAHPGEDPPPRAGRDAGAVGHKDAASVKTGLATKALSNGIRASKRSTMPARTPKGLYRCN
jgi:uncharacterized protein